MPRTSQFLGVSTPFLVRPPHGKHQQPRDRQTLRVVLMANMGLTPPWCWATSGQADLISPQYLRALTLCRIIYLFGLLSVNSFSYFCFFRIPSHPCSSFFIIFLNCLFRISFWDPKYHLQVEKEVVEKVKLSLAELIICQRVVHRWITRATLESSVSAPFQRHGQLAHHSASSVCPRTMRSLRMLGRGRGVGCEGWARTIVCVSFRLASIFALAAPPPAWSFLFPSREVFLFVVRLQRGRPQLSSRKTCVTLKIGLVMMT